MAGKVLPLGPCTFPDMVEDLEKEIAVLKVVGEPLSKILRSICLELVEDRYKFAEDV